MQTFGVHGQDDVGSKALALIDLGDDLERNLQRDEVTAGCVPVGGPAVRAAQEVLVLYVDEVLRPPDGRHVCAVNAFVNCLRGHTSLLRACLIVFADVLVS